MTTQTVWRASVAVIAVLLVTAGAAWAQLQTGDLYGVVRDNEGAPLPGATVTLSGIGAAKVQLTNAEGQFRFLALSPGGYSLVAELDGFSTVEFPNVVIRVGRNTTLELTMTAAVEEVITVTAESPLLDERKISTGTSISYVELEKIPTSRDPWGILNQTPGVLTDRVNVGGNESGQQSNFLGTGAASDDNAFAVDGVIITDMAAVGASPTYYDFDAFEEVQVTTGGTDISVATGGVTVNLVTKRGTNEWRGSGRYFLTDGEYQSSPSIDERAGHNFTGGTERTQDLSTFAPNEIDEVQDYGGEVGGFLVKDRLWVWGAYGKNDIKNLLAGASLDRTILENYNGKINAQIASPNSGVFQFSRGDKIKDGRTGLPSTLRSPETSWDQSGPTEIWKVEDTHIFSSNFFLTGLYSFVDGGFQLVTKNGGAGDKDAWVDDDFVFHGAWLDFFSDRDVDQWRLDASYFFNSGQWSHELKFGGGFREAETNSLTVHPKGRLVYSCVAYGCFDQPASTAAVKLARNRALDYKSEYSSFWAQDTFTKDRWTVNAGVRYDEQKGNNNATQVDPVVIGGRTFFAPVDFPGDDPQFTWETITPRIGVTYALGAERKTLLRANYSRFASQLGQGFVSVVNPASYTYGYAYFTDANGNLLLDDAEVGSVDVFYYYGFDPNNPSGASPNQLDAGFDPSQIDELGFGIEHALLPEFVVGAQVTWREINDLPEYNLLITDGSTVRLATAADYVFDRNVTGLLPDGTPFSEPLYALRDGLSPTGGRRLTDGDRSQEFLGLTLTATKRLTNRWMLRGNFTLYDTENKLGPRWRAIDDPTDVTEVTGILDDLDDDGGIVVEQSEGSGGKSNIWQNSRWAFNINGLYQLPLGFNIAANLSGREGYPNVRLIAATGSDGIGREVQIGDLDSDRNKDIFTVDVRVEKEFTVGGFGATISIDGFNLLNENTVLQRERRAQQNSFDFIQETLSPRIFRLGLRLRWK